MGGKEKYTLSLKGAHIYSPGTYKISFYAKSKESVIPINVKEENINHGVVRENFVTEPITLTQNETDTVEIKQCEVTVDVDKDVYTELAYLHVEVSKLVAKTDSDEDDYQECCKGKVLLQPQSCVFQETIDTDAGEVSYSGSLNLFKLLEHGFIRVVAGWIKYNVVFLKIKEVEEIEEETVNEVLVVNDVPQSPHQSINIQEASDEVDVGRVEMVSSPGPQHETPAPEKHIHTPVPKKRISQEHVKPIDTVPPVLAKPSEIDLPVVESHVLINDQVANKEDVKVTVEPSKMSVRSPEAPLSCSDLVADFPNVHAVKRLLPKFHALQNQHSEAVDPHVPIVEPVNGAENRSDYVGTSRLSVFTPTPERLLLSPHTKENLDSHVVSVLDYQTKELDRYRGVIQRMASDIMQLRGEISELQSSKNQLVMKLYYAGDGLPSDGDGSDEIIQLKRGLVAEHELSSGLKQRIHKLQNELIKKNEIEVSYVQLQQAHEEQQKVLQGLQEKMTKYKLLQETVTNQELVIEKLEKLVKNENPMASAASPGHKGSVPSRQVKRKENIKDVKKKSVTFENEAAYSGIRSLEYNANTIDEKLQLLQRVEQAEHTVHALEEQLYNNSQQWAKERSAMQRSMMNTNYSPQKLLPSRSYDHNTNYLYQPSNVPYQKTLQFPQYTYQPPTMNRPWNVP